MTDPTRMEWDAGRELAFRLIRRHPELLKEVPPLSDILFVLDKEATPKKNGRPVLAQVSRIPTRFADFVYEGDKQFMLEWFALNVHGRTINQQQVIMVHELLHFEFDEDKLAHGLRGHDFEDFRVLMDRFGYRWSDPRLGDVPDILAADFSWGKQGQARLDLQSVADGVAAAVPGTEVTVSAGGQEATVKADPDWQPPEPIVRRDNVVPLRQPTGTDQGA